MNKMVKKLLANQLMDFAKWLDGPPIEEPLAMENAPLGHWDPTDPPPQLSVEQIHVVRLDRTKYFHQLRLYHQQRQCRAHIQRKRVTHYCSICGVFLCLNEGCFAWFHELDNYLFDDPQLQGKEILQSHKKY